MVLVEGPPEGQEEATVAALLVAAREVVLPVALGAVEEGAPWAVAPAAVGREEGEEEIMAGLLGEALEEVVLGAQEGLIMEAL